MSNCVRIAGFIVLAAALTACADDLAPEVAPESPSLASERATISGHVVDAQGVAIAGATVAVRASGEHAMTDAAGAFSLDVPANTTLTLSASAPSMAPTLLQQLMVSPSANAAVEISMVTADHFKQLAAMGHNPAGGVVAVALKSMSGTGSLGGATVELTPNLGRVMYPSTSDGMTDPDPAMAAAVPGAGSYAWALGVQPHVTIMELSLHGVAQVEAPYAIDDIIWPGTFTVDAGALTLVTLFTK